MPQTNITIEIEAENQLELNDKANALNVIKNLNPSTLKKLAELAKNPTKADTQLNKHWGLIKKFF
ncbi:hypothetical protein [Aurantibacter aestuarii]|uniref:Uncharacterized protein n=1 Tax=Aurantibacter aestuarii TaxID=1266046 RepID=A0A2T1NEK1_9FLAO|nr:hypothetical protein [Aurantibacter aestuarii]PSG90878.1 hypothetical protein C7H52_06285 [Aurantibacter aestuarii]